MSLSRTLATAGRVMRQLRHDKRTVAMLVVLPTIMLVILYYVLYESHPLFNAYAPLILVMLAFTAVFIVTSMTTLSERRSGTLDKLMTLPISRLDIILGYSLAFTVMTILQTAVAMLVMLTWLDVSIGGSLLQLFLTTLLSGLAGMAFGLSLSEFAKTEFQAAQFMPAFVIPQLLTAGLLVPIDQMVAPLQWYANVMPITYTLKAVREVMLSSAWSDTLVSSLLALVVFIVVVLALGALTMRRQR